MGKHSVGFPEPAHNGKKHWPPLWTDHLCRTHKSTTETHPREASFVSWLRLAYGLGKLEPSPENKLVFIKLANAFSLGHEDERVLCRHTQGLLSTLKITRIYYSRIVYYGLKDTPIFLFAFCYPYQLFTSFWGSLLISEELSGIAYQMFSSFTCSSTKSNFNLKCNHERDSY